jgi:hypothetical protein
LGSIYITPKNVYDSFGRNTKSLLKVITAKSKTKKIKIVDSKRDAEQHEDSVVCGHMSLAWLTVVQRFGVRAALTI